MNARCMQSSCGSFQQPLNTRLSCFQNTHLVDCLLNVYTMKRLANLFALVDGLVNKDLICFILVLSSTEFSTCLQINNTTQMLAKFSAPWLKGRFLFLS